MNQEFPQPPPIYPEGTSGLPDLHGSQPNAQQLQEINAHNDAQRAILLEWWSYCYGKHSNLLGRTVLNCADVLEHAHKHMNQPTVVSTEQTSSFSERWNQWREQCVLRKAWIAHHKAELDKRKQEMADALKAMEETKRTWEAYVEVAKRDYEKAKATPAPPQPKRQ